jgi:catechol-2,3-dioxygenase
MLAQEQVIPTVAVKNLDTASRFYEQTLGLTREPSEPSTATYRAGSARLLVYESQFAGTNQATAVTWAVGDVDATVKDLKAKGLRFEHYDMPNMKHEGDVHVADNGHMRAAWFKDPDGNIHAVVSR